MTDPLSPSRAVPVADRFAGYCIAAIAFLLPWYGIGPHLLGPTRTVVGADLAILLASPILLWTVVRGFRRLVRHPVFVGILLIAAAHLVSRLLAFVVLGELRTSGAGPFLSVLVVGAVAICFERRSSRDLVLRSLMAGGALSVAVSLVGYAFVLASGRAAGGHGPFAHVSTHPIFDEWPRLSGTFALSPQHYGEYLVVLLTTILFANQEAPDPTRSRRLVILAGLVLVALALTFSFAWAGAAVLILGVLWPASGKRRAGTVAAILAVTIAVGAGSWLMNVGRPMRSGTRGPHDVACSSVDLEHTVFIHLDGQGHRCRVFTIAWPYRARLTMYLHAKMAAIAIIRNHFWLGAGRGRQYERVVTELDRRMFGSSLVAYRSPHCVYLSELASAGIGGGIGMLVLCGALVSRRPRGHRSARWLWLGAVGMLAVGINLDVLTARSLWFLLGLLVGDDLRLQSRDRGAGQGKPARASTEREGARPA